MYFSFVRALRYDFKIYAMTPSIIFFGQCLVIVVPGFADSQSVMGIAIDLPNDNVPIDDRPSMTVE